LLKVISFEEASGSQENSSLVSGYRYYI